MRRLPASIRLTSSKLPPVPSPSFWCLLVVMSATRARAAPGLRGLRGLHRCGLAPLRAACALALVCLCLLGPPLDGAAGWWRGYAASGGPADSEAKQAARLDSNRTRTDDPADFDAGARARGDADAERRDRYFESYAAVHGRERASCGRTLVFRCAARDDCGGVGDRTTGMVTAAAIATLTGRAFFVDGDAVFVPAGPVDWTHGGPGVAKCASGAGSVEHNFVGNDRLLPEGGDADLDELLPERHVVMRSNRGLLLRLLRHGRYGQILAGAGFDELNIFSSFFGRFFRPTEGVRGAVEARFPWYGTDGGGGNPLAVSLHLRVGDVAFEARLGAKESSIIQSNERKLDDWLECARRAGRERRGRTGGGPHRRVHGLASDQGLRPPEQPQRDDGRRLHLRLRARPHQPEGVRQERAQL